MSLLDDIRSLSQRASTMREQLQTEEATKNALVMPFLQALGYDVFNPLEVVPEYTADVGIKKGEKVDYAVLHAGKPMILVECKKCGSPLDGYGSQLFRYFTTTKAKIGILTDGIDYRFYTDLREPNKMDSRPFMELGLLDLREDLVDQLEKLAKPTFNLDGMLDSASDLKYTTEIQQVLSREIANPSNAFVRFFAEQVYDGRLTQNVIDRFRGLLKGSTSDFISDLVDKRLKSALVKNRPEEDTSQSDAEVEKKEDTRRIETTAHEVEGFYIVKAILRDMVSVDRITARDVQSYFGILLDDNNRKPICRLRFDHARKYLGVFDDNKTETRLPIDGPEGIFKHAEPLRRSLGHVLENTESS